VETDSALVEQLLTDQFPEWAEGPISRVPSAGTDNALYRLGDDLVVRLPRIHWAVDQVEKEHGWLPRLSPYLPLAVPEPLAMGEPGAGYPWHWSVYRWLPGENLRLEEIADPVRAAVGLAGFLLALQGIDTAGGPLAAEHGLRGVPLATRDWATRKAIGQLRRMIDVAAALGVWEAALEADEWEGEPVWFHGDMLPGNLLFETGRLRAVIDFGGLGVGDPAPDLMIAWNLFAGESRRAFREALGVDGATWARGGGRSGWR
jgi:aminoglycoside phosphotransferase (APT) family kinase protein